MPALLLGAPTGGLVGIDADLDAMAARAPALGLGAPVVERHATLSIARRRLAELVACTLADDRVLLYLTGHGGVVENLDHDHRAARPAPRRLHYFVTCPEPGGQEQPLFDVELSLWAARLAERTKNVVVIVDSCFSSGLVRDGVTADGLVAQFKAWRAEHQDPIDSLHVEAHPEVVRLSAAGVSGVARPGPQGSALTGALLAALAEHGALDLSWLALFNQIELRLARAGVAQQPRLSGPVRRRVFALEPTIPPGAFPVRSEGGQIVLEGGAQQGVARGDLFMVMAAGAESLVRVDDVAAATATLRRSGAPGDPMAAPPGSFAWPLRLRGHGGVVVTGTGPARQVVERALRAAHWELWSEQREAQALATLHCSAERTTIRSGELAAEATEASGCVEAVQRFARVARVQSLGGMTLPAMGLRAAWGRVRRGECEPLPGAGAEIDAEDPLYVRIENPGDARRFVSVFWIADDGEGVQLSRSESMGVEVAARSTYLLGDRPFTRAPRGVLPPRRPLAPGERRHERLVIVATPQRQALWSFDAGRTGGEGRRSRDLAGTEVLQFTVTASAAGDRP